MLADAQIEQIAAKYLADHSDSMLEAAGAFLKLAKEQLHLHLKTAYRKYINYLKFKHFKTKSFFIRDESVSLYDFFVPLDISLSSKKIAKVDFAKLALQNQNWIFSGAAGSGKSILMKHLLVGALETKSKVPILVELRDLNSTKMNVFAAICQVLQIGGLAFDETFVDRAFKAGHFAVGSRWIPG